MAASIYISSPNLNLQDKFILSFDVALSNKNEMLGFGLDANKRAKSAVKDFNTFVGTNISRSLIIDNGLNLIKKSTKYTADANYIWRKDNKNTEILDLEVKVIDGKVFEEVKDISSYDPKVDTTIYVEGRKLYKHVPDRYIIDKGVVKRLASTVSMTSVFSFEAGLVKVEEYHIQDNLKDFKSKFRFLITNSGTTFNLGKLVDGSYDQIGAYFFSSNLAKGYAYLYLDGVAPSNLSVTYRD